jgi:DNA-binding helix-hairpin-helix protein with protein kinase domain
MSQLLRTGQKVRTELSGMTCEVEQFLGSGGQGEVYRANLGGKPVALKWYFPDQATREEREALEALVESGAPNEKFHWPIDIASAEAAPGFGYIMPLREARYKGLVDLMKRRFEPTFRALATSGFELSQCFLDLHAGGLCFRTIDFGNVFFDPDTGSTVVPLNDAWNVVRDGEAQGGILGTPRLMAPELLLGGVPSRETDLFSLSVLLFYMLLVHHPLEGKKESSTASFDMSAMTKLYATEPLFIFDPDDRSNEPVPGYHDNAILFWPIYPQFLRDAFTRTFTDGLRDPKNGRVTEREWQGILIRLRDSVFYCRCGSENFYDAAALRVSGGNPGLCRSCHKDLQLPPRIRIGNNVIMLNHNTRLFPHHIDDEKTYDFSAAVAEVAQHPTNANIWGLKNVSSENWIGKLADGSFKDVEPGRSVSLGAGTRILFGTAEGEVRV